MTGSFCPNLLYPKVKASDLIVVGVAKIKHSHPENSITTYSGLKLVPNTLHRYLKSNQDDRQ